MVESLNGMLSCVPQIQQRGTRMDFLTGTVGGALVYILTKAAEKGGEKLLDKGLDRTFEKSGGFLAGLYHRIFHGGDFSDLLATDERRDLAISHLVNIKELLSDLIEELDVLYGSILDDRGEFYLDGKVTMQNFALAAGIVAKIEVRQGRLLELFQRTDNDFPSLLPLIGYFVVAQQSQTELEHMLQPTRQPFDSTFAFMTYVARTANSRAGLIVRCKETLQKEVLQAESGVSKGTVSWELVLQLRSFERLTHVLAYGVAYAEQLLRSKPELKAIPRAVQVVGAFARAERAIEETMREHERALHPLPRVVEDANDIRDESWELLSTPSGGMLDKLDTLERNAERIQKKLRTIQAR